MEDAVEAQKDLKMTIAVDHKSLKDLTPTSVLRPLYDRCVLLSTPAHDDTYWRRGCACVCLSACARVLRWSHTARHSHATSADILGGCASLLAHTQVELRANEVLDHTMHHKVGRSTRLYPRCASWIVPDVHVPAVRKQRLRLSACLTRDFARRA